jgi:hypothetical protein
VLRLREDLSVSRPRQPLRQHVRRRRAVAATLLVMGLAAGTTGAAEATRIGRWTVSVLPADASASSFSEPGVVAGGDGTLIVNACTANSGSPATLWRSRDFGGIWSKGFSVGGSAIGCGDSDAAIGSDGYEYSLVLGTGVSVYRSRDGRHWDGPASFPPPHGEDQPDRPWLVTVPRHPNVVYMFNSEIGGNIVEWISTDHAKTFTGPVPVTGGLNSQAALTLGSRPLVDSTHPTHPTRPARMVEFYETATFAGLASSMRSSGLSQFPLTQLWEAISTDGGRHWTNHLVLDVTSAFGVSNGTLGHLLPATAIDRDGTSYVALSVQLGTQTATHLYLMHSTRGGGWTHPSRVGESTASNVMPAIAVSRPGTLVLSWYASAAQDFSDAHATWREMVAVTGQALAVHPRFRISRLSGAQPVHVGAVDNAGAVGNDIGQNWALRDFQSVAVDSCGHPHVTWADDAGARPRTYTATTTPRCRGN